MVNGKPRHSQSQGSVERLNRDVENIIAVWKRDNNRSDWASSLPIIQFTKNARYHSGIGRSPYKAMFGKDPMLGLEHLSLAKSMVEHLEKEEDIATMFPQHNNVEEQIEEEGEEEDEDDGEHGEEIQDENDDEIHIPSIVVHNPNENDNYQQQVSDIYCFSCRHTLSSNTPNKCLYCEKLICPNPPCTVQDLCKLCYHQFVMDEERGGANRKTQKQAEKMLEMSKRRYGEVDVGSTVLLAIPDVDKGRCEFPNLKCVVLEKSNGGMYKLGCRTGVLETHYSRNQFSPTITSFMKPEEVNMERTVSVRTAAREESMGGGQGFVKCNCTGKCITKRCKCLSSGRRCNSRCHNKRSCDNID